jgi:hypothetical protein
VLVDAGTCIAGGGDAGTSCVDDLDCGLNLFCGDGGICTHTFARQTPCQSFDQCLIPDYCQLLTDGGRACVPYRDCYDMTP